jgi:predicted ATPase/DNA-binding transcriptional LysR family regulator
MNVEPRLRAFAAVARERSFSQAAERLYVSQPAISKHVASLEAELGTQLVERGRRGTTLTPAGQVLADHVLRAEALLANARRALEAGHDGQTGTLALAASGIPGTYLLPELLWRFCQDHPSVEIEFQVSTSVGALELVRMHRAELAVVTGTTAPPELEFEPLSEDELVLVGPPALGGRRLRPKDLEDQTWISPDDDLPTREAVETARSQIGLGGLRTLELPSWEAMKLAVASGAGIAAVSRLALGLELETGTLAVLDVPRWRLSRTISVVTARGVPLTGPAERFVALLRARFADKVPLPPNSNLPAFPTPLIGRDREMEELCKQLRGRERIVTLTGTGGSGKTRLALEVAALLVEDFRDGVYLVDLAPLRDAELVLPAIRGIVGLPESVDLAERLRDRRLLLVLDNFEHVSAATKQVAALLRDAPEIKVLVTSRAPLQVAHERTYPVEPLPLEDAVTLFAERALAVDPSFVLDDDVARICQRLDGLPLALELAAARVKSLTPALLLERLEPALAVLIGGPKDVPQRQRTLRATLLWSYDLLAAGEQALFSALSVFRGGWTLAAAEAVCETPLDALTSLVDKSLVCRADERFSLLETVRELAAERLRQSDDAQAVALRHAEYFRALAQRMDTLLRSGEPEEGPVSTLEADIDNLRAAAAFGLKTGDTELVREITGALPMYWIVRGLYGEARSWLERALALDDAEDETRRRLLAALGTIAYSQGDHVRAVAASDEAGSLAMNLAGAAEQFDVLKTRARTALMKGDVAHAANLLEEAMDVAIAVDNGVGTSACRLKLAYLANKTGRPDRAAALLDENLPFVRARGQSRCEAYTLAGFAETAIYRNLPEQVAEPALHAATRAVSVGDNPLVAFCLDQVAASAATRGDAARAAKLLGATEVAREAMGVVPDDQEGAIRNRALEQVDPADPRLADAWAKGRKLDLTAALELARSEQAP